MDALEYKNLAQKISELRAKEQAASLAKKEITQELEACEEMMVAALTGDGLTSFKCEYGNAVISFFTSVKTPKTPEQLAALAEYCRSVGAYDAVFKPGSAAINSFYKEQLALALEKGNADFKVPGLDEVTTEPRLSFRKV